MADSNQVTRAEGFVRAGRLHQAREVASAALEDATLDADGVRRALTLLSSLAGEVWRVPLAEPLARAAARVDDAAALGALGSVLITEREPGLAEAMLARAGRLDPANPKWLTDRVAALELLGKNARAVTVIDEAEAAAKHGFLVRYLSAFNLVLAGELERARAVELEPTSAEESFLAARVARMFARADAVAGLVTLDAEDARGWHFVITGSLLLHVARAERGGVRGRYPKLVDDDALVHEVLVRLDGVLDALALKPATVLALDGSNSHVVGRAAASVLVRPVDFVTLPVTRAGLVVAYDLGGYRPDDLASLTARAEDQLVFAHAANVSVEQRVAPDFVGVLYGAKTTPWNKHLFSGAAPRATDEATLAEAIGDSTLTDEALSDLGDLVALAVVAQAAGVFPPDAAREPQWVGSPVAAGD